MHASPIVAAPRARAPLERAKDVGGAATGRDANDDVVLAKLKGTDGGRAGSPIVFSTLDGVA